MADRFEAAYQCPKCRHSQCDIGEMRVSGGALSSIFDIENKAFTSVTCTRCSYTEFYRTQRSGLGKIVDFLTT
jgi:predicted nucleic-acid-binding Zn-ribbon protein